MKIKNITGSSKVSAKPKLFDSWLQFWEHFAGKTITRDKKYKCPACGESVLGSKFDGCHVQKVDSTDPKWYIAPLCDACNQRKDEPDVSVKLVSVADNNK